MCGIAGLYYPQGGRPVDGDLVARMRDTLSLRGPDDAGLYVGDGVGLAHRRLSIIDLAGGHQPMFNEDGTVSVVYNGEIYNFQELFEDLKAAGHIFQTHSDTEAIVHAWEEWGPDCVKRFRGMFAFALWDDNKKQLFLARDRLGIKPLYYAALADGTVLFGSELKALMAHPDLPRRIDPQAVEDYFAYGYVPDPKTIFADVKKLAPGETLLIRRDAGGAVPQPVSYWSLDFRQPEAASEADISAQLIDTLREAVKIRLLSDVPLGAFLSGGVDSSAVVAMMSQISPDPVDTFSISFAHKDYDESNYAAQLASRYGTAHHTRQVDPESFDLIDQLAAMYDEPFADSSAMPTYRVCALARERVTVALSGDGGDEVFAGYRRYRWHNYEEQVRRLLPDPVRGPLFGLAGQLYPKMDWAPKVLRAKSTLQAVAKSTIEGYFDSISIANDAIRGKLFSAAMQRDLQGYHARNVLQTHFDAAPTDDHLSRVQYVDLKTYLPGDILTKVDRTSMAVSLEVRVPILDHKFVEWSTRVPPAMKLAGREGKYIFKKALEPHVPSDLLYRPKMGFAVPIGAWFRGPLKDRVRAMVTGPRLADTGLFDPAYLTRLVDDHTSGLRNHDAVLWSLLMFDGFLGQMEKTAA
ncbi:MAG: XrtA/PEP-CTERM system amidotransferase [Magnetospiraceae bacterium]